MSVPGPERRDGLARTWAKRLARVVLRALYRLDVRGLEHYTRAGPRALIAIDPGIARRWWVRLFLGFADVLEVDPRSPAR